MENIATLIDPPASTMDEARWITHRAVRTCRCCLTCTICLRMRSMSASIRRRCYCACSSNAGVHLSGGQWIDGPDGTGQRLLDDHVHDVPTPVFALLSELARSALRAGRDAATTRETTQASA